MEDIEMNYHDIKKCDMLNGDGLRCVLFLSGCSHHCRECHNPETWDNNSGILFDDSAKKEVFEELEKDYIFGLTLSGGDPLNEKNLEDVLSLVKEVREAFPNKNIWVYTGYTYEQIQSFEPNMDKRREILSYCDVLVDGKFEKDKRDVKYPFAGSTNQKVIYLKK